MAAITYSMQGRIVKGVGGFYFVSDGSNVIMGKARGNLKKNKEILYIGDYVDYEILDDGDCIVTGVHERKNYLSRPPVSNLDILVVVFSDLEPNISCYTIDKLCLACEAKGIDVVICMTKQDIASEDSISKRREIYEKAGYPFVSVNGIDGSGIDEIKELIHGKRTVLAGPSGVGKSTLLNNLTGESKVLTGEISNKTGRGKHTTRHVEIFALEDGTEIYDTPGFTSLNVQVDDISEVKNLFPEFVKIQGNCKYSNCMHLNEPDCAVREAVEDGTISKSRYDSYCGFIEEVRKCRK